MSWCDDSVSTAAAQVTEPTVAAAQSFELKVASEQRRAASDQTAELVAAAAHKHTNSSETETPAGDILITPLDTARFRKCTSSCELCLNMRLEIPPHTLSPESWRKFWIIQILKIQFL